MGACATKPKVLKSDKAAADAPAPVPEEVVAAGVDSETMGEIKKEEELVVVADSEQSESVKEGVDAEGGNKPRSLSLLLDEDNQKAKAGGKMTSTEMTEPLESSSSEPQAKTEESETKLPESQESAIEEQQPAPAVAAAEAAEAVKEGKAIESSPAPAAEPAAKKTETAESIAKEEAKE